MATTGVRLSKNSADAPDVDVRFEDQQNINEFGRLNAKLHELKDEIEAAKVCTAVE